MIVAGEGLFLAELVLLVYCVLNVVTTPDAAVRTLPKLVWLVLVVVFPLVGGIGWLVAGRPRGAAADVPRRSARPGRVVATSPDDDEAFLQQLKARADGQRREAERRRREQQGDPGS